MASRKFVEEKLKFLLLEIEGQISMTLRLLSDADQNLVEKIIARDDYIDNLKSVIENECFTRLHCNMDIPGDEINYIRSVQIIAVNLERIADFCVNIAQQTEYLIEFRQLHQSNFQDMFLEIQRGLSAVLPALQTRSLPDTLKICQAEAHLDSVYKDNFDWIMARLRSGHYVEDLITTLFIFRYLERIGDALLNIGEALILVITGERIKIEQFEALQNVLNRAGMGSLLSEVEFKSIWGSRSGCRIGRVQSHIGDPNQGPGLFKEGGIAKVQAEKQNIERWHTILPGKAPRILGYREHDNKATLLVEFLAGKSLDSLIVGSDTETAQAAIHALEKALLQAWELTRQNSPVATDYMAQLKRRLEPICLMHGQFMRPRQSMANVEIPGTLALIERCQQVEKDNPAPFSVFIHGDFNSNNILFDRSQNKISYVDFHRSRQYDYLQDASVFLISNFRMPLFDLQQRGRINRVITHFYHFLLTFADQYQDQTVQLRLGLALARSFLTSTRFELNPDFAAEMNLRAHYLMEKIVAHSSPATMFKLLQDVLIY